MDPELERFKTDIDFRVFAASLGYELDRKRSGTSSSVMRHANNDKIVIKRDADGHYVYFSVRDETDNGTIIDFAKRRLNCSLGRARKALRAFMGLPPPILAPYTPLVRVVSNRISVERAFARMRPALRHPYLENARAIPRWVLASKRFAGCIRIDTRGNAVFPHFDRDSLSGFEIKNQGFTSFATGGMKGLWMSTIRHTDTRMVFCESAIDALSYAALSPDEQTRYASVGGKPTPAQKALIRAAASILPEPSTVVAAMDADVAGREIAEVVREAVLLTGRPDLRFEITEPQGFKDWNDALRAAKPKPTLPCRPGVPSVA